MFLELYQCAHKSDFPMPSHTCTLWHTVKTTLFIVYNNLQKQILTVILNKLTQSESSIHLIYTSLKDQFEFCLTKCRTSSEVCTYYTYIYICTYICMYICTYTYIYTLYIRISGITKI